MLVSSLVPSLPTSLLIILSHIYRASVTPISSGLLNILPCFGLKWLLYLKNSCPASSWHPLMISSKATSSLLFPPMSKKLPCTYLYLQSSLNVSTVNTLYITVINSLWVFWGWWLCFISFCIIRPMHVSWHILHPIQANWTYKGMKILLREPIHRGPRVSQHILIG